MIRWPTPLLVLSLATTVVLHGACSKKKSPEPKLPPPVPKLDEQAGDEVPVPGGQVVVHLESEPGMLNLLIHPDAWSARISMGLIHEPLVREDPRDYAYAPGLAERWEASPDSRTWTFHLRTARWHDGKPFSSRDVAFTFEKMFDPEVRADLIRASFASFGCAKWETPDDRTFRLFCEKPPFLLLTSLGLLPILPAHAMGDGDFNKHPKNREPLGTGPYRFDHWTPGREIVLVRNDDYWGRKGYLGRIIYQYVESPVTAVRLATRGEIDFVSRVREPQWVDNVQNDPKLKANFNQFVDWPNQHLVLVCNTKREVFQDVRVRRALAHLFDAETILETVMRGMGKRIATVYYDKAPGYHEGLLPYPFDPDRAGQILDEAGWKDGDGDGVRDRKGTPLRFEFLLSTVSSTLKRIVARYQQDLKKAGIQMDISPIEWIQLVERMRSREFDMLGTGHDFISPRTDPFDLYHSSQSQEGGNYAGYESREMDAALEAMRAEPDERRRVALDRRIQEIAYEDLPYIPTFTQQVNAIVHKRFRGVYTSAEWYQLDDWWVPKRLQRSAP